MKENSFIYIMVTKNRKARCKVSKWIYKDATQYLCISSLLYCPVISRRHFDNQNKRICLCFQVFYTSFSGDESASGAPSPRAALRPGCRGRHGHWEQPWCRELCGQRFCHNHGAAPSEQAWDGKSQSPQHISGFASTGQQRVKNRSKNEGRGLKYSFFYSPVSNSTDSLGSSWVQGMGQGKVQGSS